ncbi:unnamed protein product [Linum tenue]|uniref:Uncharacterized protein n=1 Tax=Linum tenue TaxID=586396 RepID=A0AAV0RY65_9ROSI|nr:unnamed protein product [Linum tenue]
MSSSSSPSYPTSSSAAATTIGAKSSRSKWSPRAGSSASSTASFGKSHASRPSSITRRSRTPRPTSSPSLARVLPLPSSRASSATGPR